MSVVFQHLYIPKNCMECEWRDAEACGECELMIGNPFDTLKEQYNHCPFRVISKRHPLIPVPEHVDLIDRHDLKNKEITIDYDEWDDTFEDGLLFVADLIDNASTIIPAEEGET